MRTVVATACESWQTHPAKGIRLATPSAEPILEPEPVLDRVAVPVVVEVRVDIVVRPPLLDPLLPILELTLGVVAVPASATVVEADERPVGGQVVRLEGSCGMIADHERDRMLTQERRDVRHEPARMAELDAVAARREALECRGEPLVVPAKVPGKLPEDRTELRRADERFDAVVEALDACTEIAQAPDVR